MKAKVLILLMAAVLAVGLFVGCSSNTNETSGEPQATPSASQADKSAEGADAVTTASIVNDASALPTALGKDGNFVDAILCDLSTDEELVLEGDFHNKNDDSQPLYHKLALYAQDENHKVTERYTLTAPKLTIKSTNAKIQGGTFKGDVYVEANGFTVQDATIDGNIYFAKQEYKDSFVLPTEEGKAGKVTGTMEVK